MNVRSRTMVSMNPVSLPPISYLMIRFVSTSIIRTFVRQTALVIAWLVRIVDSVTGNE